MKKLFTLSALTGGTLTLNAQFVDGDGLDDNPAQLTFNMANQSANASVPPVAPTHLLADIDTGDELMITFSWNTPSSESGKQGNVFTNTSYKLYDLLDGIYEWSVQTINAAYLGGAFAPTQTFQIGTGSGFGTVNYYKPKVYELNKKLIIESAIGEVQSLKVYAANGTMLVSTSFINNTEIDLPAGIYIIEPVKADAAPFRTKVPVKYYSYNKH
jgi:hypothetical protein